MHTLETHSAVYFLSILFLFWTIMLEYRRFISSKVDIRKGMKHWKEKKMLSKEDNAEMLSS